MARYTFMLPNLARNRILDGIPENMVQGVLQMFVGAVDIKVIAENRGNVKPLVFSLHPESVVYA